MTTRRLFLPTIPITVFVLLFGISAYLGASTTYDPALVGDSLLAVFVSVIAYLLGAYLVRTRYIARYTSLILMELCAGFALLFISQFRYQDYPELSGIIQTLGNATTFLPDLSLGYLHPNAVATVLEVVFPMAVAFALARRQTAYRVAGGIMALVLLYAIFLTYSRGAYVGLAGALVVLGVAYGLSRLPRVVSWTAAGVAAVMAIIVVVALFNLNPAQPIPILNSAVDPRLTLYHNSLYLARDYAFTGIGMGNTFANVYSRYSLLIQPLFLSYTSNLLLSVWLNQGLLGLVAFLGLIVTYYRYVARIARRTQPSIMFHGLWLGVTASLIHGLFDARQYTESPLVMPVLFIAIGLTVAYAEVALREEGLWLSIRRWLQRGLWYALPAFIICLIAFLALQTTLVAAWYTSQGAQDETRADFAPGLTQPQRQLLRNSAAGWYARALETSPDYAPANRRLGNLHVAREEYETAIPLLEGAYAAEPTNPAAIKGLGLAYAWAGRTQDAAQVLKGLPNLNDMANELYTWGYFWSGEEQNQPLLAAYAWEAAEFMGDAGNTDVWMQIAGFYEQANVMDREKAAYQHVLDIDPNHKEARDALSKLS
ncbi:MAG: O-antigen ligase family protein [Anaerolineae bacterium]|nr:O-antigen ligase family protein [Anaerolineae bacterium]